MTNNQFNYTERTENERAVIMTLPPQNVSTKGYCVLSKRNMEIHLREMAREGVPLEDTIQSIKNQGHTIATLADTLKEEYPESRKLDLENMTSREVFDALSLQSLKVSLQSLRDRNYPIATPENSSQGFNRLYNNFNGDIQERERGFQETRASCLKSGKSKETYEEGVQRVTGSPYNPNGDFNGN